MSILSIADLSAANDKGTKQRYMISKAAITGTVGGQSSLWRSAGIGPVPAATTPTSAAACTSITTGGLFYPSVSGVSTVVSRWQLCSSVVQTIELHDRLANMGGIVENSTAAQTVNIDLQAMANGSNNLNARIRDYSQVAWWIEVYVATGTTSLTYNIAYTDHTGVSQTVQVVIGASNAIGKMIPIIPNSGTYIRAISTVTLAAATTNTSSTGITATVEKTCIACPIANILYDNNAGGLITPIADNSCLFYIADTTTTTTGVITGAITLVQG